MRTKAERRIRHVTQLKTARAVSPQNKSANREIIIKSGSKTHKVIKADGRQYFIELDKTK